MIRICFKAQFWLIKTTNIVGIESNVMSLVIYAGFKFLISGSELERVVILMSWDFNETFLCFITFVHSIFI